MPIAEAGSVGAEVSLTRPLKASKSQNFGHVSGFLWICSLCQARLQAAGLLAEALHAHLPSNLSPCLWCRQPAFYWSTKQG
jgi:hypothetical protein